MKTRLKWLVIPAFALGLGACKKEAPPSKTDTASDQPGVVEKAVEKMKEVVEEVIPAKPAVSAEERGEKLGFAKHLPKNIESLVTVYNATKTADRAKTLKLWKFIEDEMGTEAAIEPPAEEAADVAVAPAVIEGAIAAEPDAGPAETTQPTDPAPVAPATDEAVVQAEPADEAAPAGFDHQSLWGAEVTIALGDASGEQISNLLKLYSRFGYFQIRNLTKSLVAQAKDPEAGGMSDLTDTFSEEMVSDLLNDPDGGIGTIEKLGFPPIYIAMKVDAAKREEAAQQISSSLGFLGSFQDFAEPVEVEKAGAKFSGYKLMGAKLAENMAGSREEMEQVIEADVLDRLFATVAKKDIVALSGTVGDYVVLFIGGSADQLELAAEVKESLAGEKALGFSDEYLAKDLAALVYGEKESLKVLMDSAASLSDTAKGIRDGLSGEDGLGETREIESLLQMVVEREEALRKLSRFSDSGTIAFYEEGLKIESFGGADQGAVDWNAPAMLGHLGDSPDVVLFANGNVDAGYEKASRELIESVFETAYAITRKVSDLPGENPDLVQFKEMAKLFDEHFRTDAVGLWKSLSGNFSDGLGQESALVVDMKGTFPAIPGVPQAVVDQGKFPRASFITPVVDRAKIAASWDEMNQSATRILGKISELTKKEIPMQKPLSSEKNDLTTWFFPMPFFNDDFLPSVTVGDKWFVASTSKNHAVDLIAKAAIGSEGRKGVVFKMNFVALQDYAKEMRQLVDANADAIFGEKVGEYQANKEKIQKVIDAMDDFDHLTIRSNRESDEVRTSVHFKTR